MHTIIVFACLCGLIAAIPPPAPYNDHCLVGEQNKYNQSHALDVPWYTIDLDLPPHERWKNVSRDYKDKIVELIGVIKNLSLPLFHGKLIGFVDKYVGAWDRLMKQPYHDEIMGIANVTEMNMGEIVLYNVFYELFTVCTSIVAMNDTGHLHHARNLGRRQAGCS